MAAKVAVGYNDCCICGVECPGPTDEQLLLFARSHGDDYLWPGPDDNEYMPAGWSFDLLEDGDEGGLLCDECTTVKRNALNARRRKLK